MRSVARALALATGTLLVVGFTPNLAFAASPSLVSTSPANGAFVHTAPGALSATFDGTLSPTSTISVTGQPAGNGSFCQLATVSGSTVSCSTSTVPASTLKDGLYTVHYSGTEASAPGTPVTGDFSFTVDSSTPAAPTFANASSTYYNKANKTASDPITVTGSAGVGEDGDSVAVTLASSGGAPTKTVTTTAGVGGAFTATFVGSDVNQLADGTLSLSARSTDKAGNLGDVGTKASYLVKDTAPPTLVSTAPANGGAEQSSTSGVPNGFSAVANEPLSAASSADLFSTTDQLAVDPTVTGSTFKIVLSGGGTLPAGAYSTTFTLVDAAGNAASPVTQTFSVDNTAPNAPTVTAVTNPVNGTNKNAVAVSGTAEAGATVTVTLSDGTHNVSGTGTATGGSFSVTGINTTSPTLLSDGTLTVTATATDAAGNVSGTSAPVTTLKDTVKPTVSGQQFDKSTYNASQSLAAVINGIVGDGAGGHEADSVSISVDDTDPATAPVTDTVTSIAADGTFSKTLDLSSLHDSTLTATIIATDAHGNASTTVTATSTLDATAPVKPTVVLSHNPVNNANKTDFEVSGTTEPSATVTVTVDDTDGATSAVTVTVAANGTTGAYTTAALPLSGLTDGTLTVSVTAVDAPGNPSATGTATVPMDRVAPNAPTGLSAPTYVTSSSLAAVPLSGSAEPLSTVHITATDAGAAHTATATTTAAADGTWSKTVSLTGFNEGTVTFSVTASDSAGNTGVAATTTSTKDTVAPGTPGSVTTTPSAYLYADRGNKLTVSGTTAAGDASATGLVADITISDGDAGTADLIQTVGVSSGAFTADFTADPQMASQTDGTLTVSVVIRDQAGNTSAARTASLVKDTTKLVLLTPTPADGARQQSVSSVVMPFNEALNQSTSTIVVKNKNGLAVAGSTVFSNGGKTMTFTPNTAFSEAGSTYTVIVHAVDLNDAADKVDPSDTTFTIDVTPPAAPDLSSLTTLVTGANKTAVSVSGTAESGAQVTVTLTVGGTSVTATGPATGGSFTFSPIDTSSLPDGTISATATATDVAGNTGPASSALTATKDTTGPAQPTVTVSSPINATTKSAVTVSGTTEAGAGVLVTVDDTSGATAPVSQSVTANASSGAYAASLDLSGLADGTLTVTAVATDTYDNVGTPATATAPKDVVTPVVASLAATASHYGAASSVITGTVSEAATVQLSATDGTNTVSAAATVAPDKSFSGSLNLTSLIDGTVTVKAVATDTLANVGQASTTTTRDSATPPSAPTIVSAVAGDRRAVVSFHAPTSTGGAAITGYTVRSAPGGITATGTASPLAVTGLTNGVDYTFTVTATNRVGGTASGPSDVVTPYGVSTMSFNALPSKVVYGSSITISGTLHRSDTSVPADQVYLLARSDNGSVSAIAALTPSSTGYVSITFRPSGNRSYILIYPGDERNDEGDSVVRRTLVAAKVSAYAPSGSHTVAQVITGAVAPNKAGKVVTLYRVTSTGSLVRLATATLTSKSTYRFSVKLPAGYTKLMVYISSTPNNVAGSVRFTAHRT